MHQPTNVTNQSSYAHHHNLFQVHDSVDNLYQPPKLLQRRRRHSLESTRLVPINLSQDTWCLVSEITGKTISPQSRPRTFDGTNTNRLVHTHDRKDLSSPGEVQSANGKLSKYAPLPAIGDKNEGVNQQQTNQQRGSFATIYDDDDNLRKKKRMKKMHRRSRRRPSINSSTESIASDELNRLDQLFENVFLTPETPRQKSFQDEEDLESSLVLPVPSTLTKPHPQPPERKTLVRTNTYEVLHPIVVDDWSSDDDEEVSQSDSETIGDLSGPARGLATARPPPTRNHPNEVVLIVRLPEGEKLYGYFNRNDKLSNIVDYAAKQSGQKFDKCQLIFNSLAFTDLTQTLADANLKHLSIIRIRTKILTEDFLAQNVL